MTEVDASPYERAVKAVAEALVGYVDPYAHALSEYGLAVEIVPIVLKAIRELDKTAVSAAVLSTVDVWDDERSAEREFRTEFSAAIDAMLPVGMAAVDHEPRATK